MMMFELQSKTFQNDEPKTKSRSVMEESLNNQTNERAASDLSLNSSATEESFIDLPKLWLASSSPRRSQILQIVGWPFEVGAVEVDESLLAGESPRQYVERLAAAKAEAAANVHSHRPVVAANTKKIID